MTSGVAPLLNSVLLPETPSAVKEWMRAWVADPPPQQVCANNRSSLPLSRHHVMAAAHLDLISMFQPFCKNYLMDVLLTMHTRRCSSSACKQWNF